MSKKLIFAAATIAAAAGCGACDHVFRGEMAQPAALAPMYYDPGMMADPCPPCGPAAPMMSVPGPENYVVPGPVR